MVVRLTTFNAARHGRDVFAGHQVADGLAQRLGMERRVPVHAQDELAIGGRNASIEGSRLPTVGLGDDPDQGAAVVSLEDDGLAVGVVARAVVDDDHLVTRVVELQQGLDRALDARLFVVGGHEDRDQGQDVLGQILLVQVITSRIRKPKSTTIETFTKVPGRSMRAPLSSSKSPTERPIKPRKMTVNPSQ
jgi:hypothetical protein